MTVLPARVANPAARLPLRHARIWWEGTFPLAMTMGYSAADDEAATRPLSHPPRSIGGRFRLDRFLAAGSFGTVYEGRYSILDQERRVAIKLLKAAAGADPATTLRFREEVKTLCLLDHPNICKVIDGGVDGDTMFLVMDYAEGGSLKARLQSTPGGIDPQPATRWLMEAAQGLLAAEQNRTEHGQPAPVHHRDLKPENLLLHQGRVVVADFGAARQGGDEPGITSELVPASWTPDYGSPEQMSGAVDHRSDIYSLGATFFHLLTGQVTRMRLASPAARFEVAHDPHQVNRRVPKRLGAIVRRMTEPDPARRYQSFAALLADLEAMQKAPPKSWKPKVAIAALALATVALALQAGGGVSWFGTAVVVDEQALPLVTVRDQCLAVQRGLAALPPVDGTMLPELRRQYDALSRATSANLAAIAKLQQLGVTDTMRPRLAADFVPVADLEQRFDRLRTLLPEHLGAAEEFDGLAAALEASSVLQARQRLDALRAKVRRLVDDGPLRERLTALEASINLAETVRRASVSDLRRRLDAGELEGLAVAAGDLAAKLRASGEVELATEARRVAAAAERAAAVIVELPTWSAERSGAALDLSGLGIALDRLGSLDPTRIDGLLRDWWSRIAGDRRRAWAAPLAATFRREAEALNAAASTFNERVDVARRERQEPPDLAAEARRLGDDRLQLERLRSELEALIGRGLDDVDLARALRTSLRTLSPVPARTAIDLADFEQRLQDRPDHRNLPVALEQAGRQLEVAYAALQVAIGTARSAPPAPNEWGELYARDTELVAARESFTRARRTYDELQAVQRELPDRAGAESARRCLPNQSTEQFAALELLREQVSRGIAQVVAARRAAIEAVEGAFGGGAEDPVANGREATRLASEMRRRGEVELAARAAAVAASAEQAGKRLATLPTWRSTPAAGRELADLQRFVEAIGALAMAEVDGEDRLLALWWNKRRQAIAAAWCTEVEQRCQQLRREFESAFAAVDADPDGAASRAALTVERDAAEQLRQQLLASGAPFGIRWFGAATSVPLPQLPPRAGLDTPPPDGWPDARFAPPPGIQSLLLRVADANCRELYPAEFLARAERAGARLWYLPGRTVGTVPVYQVWCCSSDRQRAALIDVHPVTFAELPRELSTTEYRGSAFRDLPAAAMLFDSSRSIAQRYAAAISERVNRTLGGARPIRFELPPDDHRSWPGCEPFLAATAVVTKDGFQPVVDHPLAGLAGNGLGYLYGGLREWTVGGVVGAAEIRGRGDDAPRQRDVGFRLALVLARR